MPKVSQFTSPKVDISDALSEKDKVKFTVHTRTGHHLISFSSFLTRNAEPSHHIPYQRLAFFISNATYPGMPEFAKSEFSVIRLHEVKTMRKIRKQQWEKFFSERGVKNIPNALPVPRTSSGYMMWYKKIYNMQGSSFRQRWGWHLYWIIHWCIHRD